MLKQFNFPEKIWWQRITPIFSYFHQFVLQHTKNFETLIRSQNSFKITRSTEITKTQATRMLTHTEWRYKYLPKHHLKNLIQQKRRDLLKSVGFEPIP